MAPVRKERELAEGEGLLYTCLELAKKQFVPKFVKESMEKFWKNRTEQKLEHL